MSAQNVEWVPLPGGMLLKVSGPTPQEVVHAVYAPKYDFTVVAPWGETTRSVTSLALERATFDAATATARDLVVWSVLKALDDSQLGRPLHEAMERIARRANGMKS